MVLPLAMAGTDRSRAGVSGGPAIILVEPQLGENIGTAARAMMNCGLDDLRLVRPRDGWPSDKAIAAASGADVVLERARLFADVPAAIADLVHVYAATARDRGMVRREVTPRRAAAEMRAWFAAGEPCGVLIGPERTGLLNDGKSEPATKKEYQSFFDHLEEELEKNGFLRNREARPSMVRNLRSLFQRAQCTEQELRTLHGIVTAFAGPRERVTKTGSG